MEPTLYDFDDNHILTKKHGFPWIILAGVAVISFMAFGLAIYHDRQKEKSINANTSGTLTIGTWSSQDTYSDSPLGAPSSKEADALSEAIKRWESALGRKLPIDRPVLKIGIMGSCQSSVALACCVYATNQIILAQSDYLGDKDLTTLLMHEVGHLIGVPHIELDPLMNPSYVKKVGMPTPFAIALARASIAQNKAILESKSD